MEVTQGSFRIDLHDVLADDEHGVALVPLSASRDGRSINVNGVDVYGKVAEVWTVPVDQHAFDEFIGGPGSTVSRVDSFRTWTRRIQQALQARSGDTVSRALPETPSRPRVTRAASPALMVFMMPRGALRQLGQLVYRLLGAHLWRAGPSG